MGEEGDDLREAYVNASGKWAEQLTVIPLWPPITGTMTAGAIDRSLWISETKVEARTTSNVVTPKSLRWCV